MHGESGGKTRLQSRMWHSLAAAVLTLSLARAAAAQDEKIALWLRGGQGDEPAMEQALRLELNARHVTLLSSPAPAASTGTCGNAIAAARSLAQTAVDAVLWLEPDATRRILWLRVLRKASDQIAQAPLPNTRRPIDPGVFAIAAASLLEQVLRAAPAQSAPAPASGAAGPHPEPPRQP
jgi:hypothetical protein